MATIALTAAGAAIGGPIAPVIGGMIGGYIDQRFLFPAIFGQPELPDAPRLGNVQLQTASEGTPMHKCFGPENRLAGTIIWISDLIEVKNNEEVDTGGKGGGGQTESVTTYTYFVDVAIGLCEGEIQDVAEIWADGKKIFDSDPNVSISSNTLSCTTEMHYRFAYISLTRLTATWGMDYLILIIESPNGGPDLTQLRSGVDATIGGWAEGSYNGTFRVLSSWEDTATGKTFVRLSIPTTASQAGEAAGNTITATQTLPSFSAARLQGVTVYAGDGTQVADSLIESYEGAGNVPPFRETAYIVIQRLALADFGNRVPQMSFLIEADTSKTVATTVGDLLERGGLVAGQYDVTGLTGNVRGYTISGPQSIKSALAPVMKAHDIAMQEANNALAFIHQKNASSVAITTDDLAAHEAGGDVSRPIQVADAMGIDLPSQVQVQFIEADSDYQQGNQREMRVDVPATANMTIALPLVMDSEDAREIALRELWVPQVNRQVVKLQLPPSYFHVQENDLVTLTALGESWTVLVKKVDRGYNGLLMLEGVVEDVSVRTQDGAAETTAGTTPTVYVPPEMILEVLDIPALLDKHTKRPYFYIAACLRDSTEEWLGATFYRSVDGQTFSQGTNLKQQARMGEVIGAIATGPVGYWDRETTITVRMANGELESKTELEVLNGENWAVIGPEIIAFQTATLTDVNTYALTNLLRGLRGTENFTVHSAGDFFVHLGSGAIQSKSASRGSIGTTREYKAVASGGTVADFPSISRMFVANSVRPFAPGHFDHSWDGSDNLTMTWVRRSRAIFRLFELEVVVPLLESSEAYKIDIMSGSTVLRTIDIAAATTATYTAAQQTADGLTPGDPVTVRLYQVSGVVNRSFVNEQDVPGS